MSDNQQGDAMSLTGTRTNLAMWMWGVLDIGDSTYQSEIPVAMFINKTDADGYAKGRNVVLVSVPIQAWIDVTPNKGTGDSK